MPSKISFHSRSWASTETASYYRWENREGIGFGFFKVDEAAIQPGEACLKATTASTRDKEYYLIGKSLTVGLQGIQSSPASSATYRMDGVRATEGSRQPIVIRKGKKGIGASKSGDN